MSCNELIIEELRQLAQRRNALDPEVLFRIQEDLAIQVMQMYRDEFKRLLDEQRKQNVPEDKARAERHALFYARINQEYKNRALNGGHFSLPMYLEAAERHYRLEIRRLLQYIQDYVAHASVVAQEHVVTQLRDMRAKDPKMDDLARAVSGSINKVRRAFERMSLLGEKVAKRYVDDLAKELQAGLAEYSKDPFAAWKIREVQLFADAERELEDLRQQGARPA